MARVMVTGSGGYIGNVLVPMLLKEGHSVIGVDRFYFGEDLIPLHVQKNNFFQIVKRDIRDLKPSDFEGVDVVMDLAGLSNDPSCDLDPQLTRSINFDGGMNIARCAKGAGVKRLIYSSSCSVYGTGVHKQLKEDSDKAPVSEYAKAKIDMESGLLDMADDHFCVTFLRNATVYGLSPRMRFDLIINVMTLHAWKNHRVFVLGGGKQWRPLVHVEDVSRAFIQMIDAPREKIHKEAFNVGSTDHNYQVHQVANIIRGVVPETEIIEISDDADKRSYNVSFEKIKTTLGFEVTRSPIDGAKEVKHALETGRIDPTDPRTITIKYYEYLLSAEDVMRKIAVNGKIF